MAKKKHYFLDDIKLKKLQPYLIIFIKSDSLDTFHQFCNTFAGFFVISRAKDLN